MSALPAGLWCSILLGPPTVPFCPLAGCAAGRLRDPWEKGEDPRAYKPDGTKVSEVRKNRGIEGREELVFQISLFSLMQSLPEGL